MSDSDFPAPSEGFVATQFLVSADVAASRDFYERVLGGKTVMDGGPTIVKLANTGSRSMPVVAQRTTNPRLCLRCRLTPTV